MKVVKLKQILKKGGKRKEIIKAMQQGDIFVYPTDTIYGIGCNAEILDNVEKITEAKGREEGKTFSVIAPGKDWIFENADLSETNKKFADDILPGPYTIVAEARGNTPKSVVSNENSIGIRLPSHPIAGIIEEAGIPFVSTSVNLSGEEPVTSIKDIPGEIEEITDWAIDAGKIPGHSSRVFDLRKDEIKILRY